MATPTYDLISEQVLGSAVNSVTFSSIPGTYKDLIMEISCVSQGWMYGRINGDSGTNYSRTALRGDGTAASSFRGSNQTLMDYSVDFGSAGRGVFVIQFNSYANTSMNKTVLYRGGLTTTYVQAGVILWRSTGAITSLSFYPDGYTGYNFAVGSTFRLYGIAG